MGQEIVGTMMVNGEVVAFYNAEGQALYVAEGWALVDGSLIQTKPVRVDSPMDAMAFFKMHQA